MMNSGIQEIVYCTWHFYYVYYVYYVYYLVCLLYMVRRFFVLKTLPRYITPRKLCVSLAIQMAFKSVGIRVYASLGVNNCTHPSMRLSIHSCLYLYSAAVLSMAPLPLSLRMQLAL